MDDGDERERVISGLVEELRAVKEELKRMRAESAAPTEELSEEQAIAAEADRRRQEAAREAKVRAALDPRELRLKALAAIYKPELLGETK
ncbi:MAG: hypothetical protein IT371_20150 [Deltaproteobacteria bacterium]|nr:hypothetical protein [Deltaproteobacteria bacterium]